MRPAVRSLARSCGKGLGVKEFFYPRLLTMGTDRCRLIGPHRTMCRIAEAIRPLPASAESHRI
jgi:hypothetical protein